MIGMKVLKTMPFRGVVVEPGTRIEADDEKQADLLTTIGLAERVSRGRGYRRRDMRAESAAVVEAAE